MLELKWRGSEGGEGRRRNLDRICAKAVFSVLSGRPVERKQEVTEVLVSSWDGSDICRSQCLIQASLRGEVPSQE